MSGGTREVQATFWLLDAPGSLLLQSRSQPDGVGLGTFGADGSPTIYRKPVAALRSQTFIADAKEVRSRTFLSHIRHATATEPRLENTHPFEQHGRLFAHNGIVGDLDGVRRRARRARRHARGRGPPPRRAARRAYDYGTGASRGRPCSRRAAMPRSVRLP
jgi:predicted glutamine amidotransferase